MRTAVYSAAFIKCSLLLALIAGCVTINVYFPAAAAEKAADRFINDVLGPEESQPQSRLNWDSTLQASGSWALKVGEGLLNFVVPAAHAEANIDMSSPAIQTIKSQMTQRHQQLKPHFDSGAVGYTANGLVAVRDQGSIPLAQRNTVRKLVADENADRDRLYGEIAAANGHPEWENDIRSTYAARWIANSKSGWYYQTSNGGWTQK